MRISRMGIKFNKYRSSEESLSHEILFQCSQIKRHAAGIYGLGHFLVKARNKLINVLRNNLEDFGCAEVSLPVLQPKFLWENSGRFTTFTDNKQMFVCNGRNSSYCLAPTGEEIVIDFVNNNISSYKDLPINIYQIGNKYRDEIRVRGGLLRSKEFLMKDAYSFHKDAEDMVREYNSMKECYKKIFSDLELDVIIVKALSADMGGKVSEEFMVFSNIGEDKILIDKNNNVAFNVEVLQNNEILNDLKNKFKNFSVNNLTESSCIELGHIFQLGTFYSEKMDGFFTDKDGTKKPYYMGCYGIGVNRILGAICENFCDEQGLNWPKSIAPYNSAVIYSKNHEKQAIKIYEILNKNEIKTVLFDTDDGFGSKIKNAKLLGLKNIIIIGKNFSENSKIEIENRKTGEKFFIELENLTEFLKKN